MRNSKIPCPSCGESLVDIAGIGEKQQKLICNNASCTSHYKHRLCPECNSAEKSDVKVLGLGNQFFKCGNCGNEWSSI